MLPINKDLLKLKLLVCVTRICVIQQEIYFLLFHLCFICIHTISSVGSF